MINWAVLILRLALGTIFILHGAQKAFGMFAGPGIEGFSKMLSGLGFQPAIFWAYLAAYTEFFGGLLIVLGIFTRFASAAILILLIAAALTVHLKNGFFLQNGGIEYIFVLAGISIALILIGPGKFSIFGKP